MQEMMPCRPDTIPVSKIVHILKRNTIMSTVTNSNTATPRNKLHLELSPEFNLNPDVTNAPLTTSNLIKRHALSATLVIIVAGVVAALLHAFSASTGNSGTAISVIPAVLMG